jgi:hypothetical protein
MNINQALMEAVDRYNRLDEEFFEARQNLADLLKQASENQQVTNLARMTKINRTTIYWLMRTWSRSENRSSGNNGNKG